MKANIKLKAQGVLGHQELATSTMHKITYQSIKKALFQKYELQTHLVILTLVSICLFFLGNDALFITDPVESNYVLTAKEMVAAHNYMSPQIYGNYWYDKPIFFYWELIGAFKLWGISEWSARFFTALTGLLGLYLTYGFTTYLYNRKTALVSSLVLGTSFEYWLISKAVITDMTLFVFFSASLICFYLGYKTDYKWYWGAYGFAALAVLTKGPIGLLLPGLIAIIFLLMKRDVKAFKHMKLFSGFLFFFVIGLPWYLYMYAVHGMDFVMVFLGVHNVLRATVSEHPNVDVWYYYTGIFCIGFVPWVFTLPIALRNYWKEHNGQIGLSWSCLKDKLKTLDDTTLFLLIWAGTVFFFFQNMATKYTTYTLPYMMPIAILMGRMLVTHVKIVRYLSIGSMIVYTILTFMVAIPYCYMYSGGAISKAVTTIVKSGDIVVSYGDYRASSVFYSNQLIYRLAKAEDIPSLRPSAMNWNNKNVMPFVAEEKINQTSHVVALVSNKREKDFLENLSGRWEVVERFPKDTLYRKVSLEK
ncbi:glycosyltransferase family 39 protein [uncultured Veillonella sp.]|uniref:ArnT family glycosyltransferase n=1 Tax=uncultured Veillonella sp. TaxID=159268 RepID=UPI0026286E23|nr:glycosyltransferase family 39 protein [uncultured Veillonella sp.]